MLATDVKVWEFEITHNCNLQCPLCARTSQGMPLWNNKEISFDNIKTMFPPELIKGNKFKLCGTRGDPIVHPECLEICDYLTSNGAKRVTVSTNGGYNNVDWWTRLAKTGAVAVFALDGGPETLHMYRINVKWENVDRNLRAFVNAGGEAEAHFIVFNHNEIEFNWIVDYCKELQIPLIKRTSGRNIFEAGTKATTRKGETVTYSQGETLKHNDLDSVKQAVKTIQSSRKSDLTPEEKRRKMLQAMGELPADDSAEAEENAAMVISTIKCKHYDSPELYLDPDGRVWPCCFIYDNNEHRGKYIDRQFGNSFNSLHEHTLQEVLDSEYFTTISQRWNPQHNQFEMRCVKTCGNNAAYMNKLDKVV